MAASIILSASAKSMPVESSEASRSSRGRSNAWPLGLVLAVSSVLFVAVAVSLLWANDHMQTAISAVDADVGAVFLDPPVSYFNSTSLLFPPCGPLGFGPYGRQDFDRFFFPNYSNAFPFPRLKDQLSHDTWQASSPILPPLRDAFVDDSVLHCVLNMKNCANRLSSWSCVFAVSGGATVKVNAQTNYEKKKTFVVSCLVPEGKFDSVSLLGNFTSGVMGEYKNIHACALAPKPAQPVFMGLCTSVELSSGVTRVSTIEEWAAMHLVQGFTQAVLYVNNDTEEIISALSKSPLAPMFTFVDWNYPVSLYPHYDQPAQQVSCIYRARSRFVWLGLNDVDEFFIPNTTGNATMNNVSIILKNHNDQAAGVRFCNKWYGVKQGPTAQLAHGLDNNYGFSSWWKCSRSRGKVVVRPERVRDMLVHSITESSGPKFRTMREIDESQGLMAHARSERCFTCTAENDTRLMKWWPAAKAVLEGRGA